MRSDMMNKCGLVWLVPVIAGQALGWSVELIYDEGAEYNVERSDNSADTRLGKMQIVKQKNFAYKKEDLEQLSKSQIWKKLYADSKLKDLEPEVKQYTIGDPCLSSRPDYIQFGRDWVETEWHEHIQNILLQNVALNRIDDKKTERYAWTYTGPAHLDVSGSINAMQELVKAAIFSAPIKYEVNDDSERLGAMFYEFCRAFIWDQQKLLSTAMNKTSKITTKTKNPVIEQSSYLGDLFNAHWNRIKPKSGFNTYGEETQRKQALYRDLLYYIEDLDICSFLQRVATMLHFKEEVCKQQNLLYPKFKVLYDGSHGVSQMSCSNADKTNFSVLQIANPRTYYPKRYNFQSKDESANFCFSLTPMVYSFSRNLPHYRSNMNSINAYRNSSQDGFLTYNNHDLDKGFYQPLAHDDSDAWQNRQQGSFAKQHFWEPGQRFWEPRQREYKKQSGNKEEKVASVKADKQALEYLKQNPEEYKDMIAAQIKGQVNNGNTTPGTFIPYAYELLPLTGTKFTVDDICAWIAAQFEDICNGQQISLYLAPKLNKTTAALQKFLRKQAEYLDSKSYQKWEKSHKLALQNCDYTINKILQPIFDTNQAKMPDEQINKKLSNFSSWKGLCTNNYEIIYWTEKRLASWWGKVLKETQRNSKERGEFRKYVNKIRAQVWAAVNLALTEAKPKDQNLNQIIFPFDQKSIKESKKTASFNNLVNYIEQILKGEPKNLDKLIGLTASEVVDLADLIKIDDSLFDTVLRRIDKVMPRSTEEQQMQMTLAICQLFNTEGITKGDKQLVEAALPQILSENWPDAFKQNNVNNPKQNSVEASDSINTVLQSISNWFSLLDSTRYSNNKKKMQTLCKQIADASINIARSIGPEFTFDSIEEIIYQYYSNGSESEYSYEEWQVQKALPALVEAAQQVKSAEELSTKVEKIILESYLQYEEVVAERKEQSDIPELKWGPIELLPIQELNDQTTEVPEFEDSPETSNDAGDLAVWQAKLTKEAITTLATYIKELYIPGKDFAQDIKTQRIPTNINSMIKNFGAYRIADITPIRRAIHQKLEYLKLPNFEPADCQEIAAQVAYLFLKKQKTKNDQDFIADIPNIIRSTRALSDPSSSYMKHALKSASIDYPKGSIGENTRSMEVEFRARTDQDPTLRAYWHAYFGDYIETLLGKTGYIEFLKRARNTMKTMEEISSECNDLIILRDNRELYRNVYDIMSAAFSQIKKRQECVCITKEAKEKHSKGQTSKYSEINSKIIEELYAKLPQISYLVQDSSQNTEEQSPVGTSTPLKKVGYKVAETSPLTTYINRKYMEFRENVDKDIIILAAFDAAARNHDFTFSSDKTAVDLMPLIRIYKNQKDINPNTLNEKQLRLLVKLRRAEGEVKMKEKKQEEAYENLNTITQLNGKGNTIDLPQARPELLKTQVDIWTTVLPLLKLIQLQNKELYQKCVNLLLANTSNAEENRTGVYNFANIIAENGRLWKMDSSLGAELLSWHDKWFYTPLDPGNLNPVYQRISDSVINVAIAQVKAYNAKEAFQETLAEAHQLDEAVDRLYQAFLGRQGSTRHTNACTRQLHNTIERIEKLARDHDLFHFEGTKLKMND